MAANTDPIFSRAPIIQWIGPLITQNTTADLTGGGTTYLAFTADATNGGFVTKIRFHATPAGNTTATVIRVFINNGNPITVATNNILFDEITLPATTASAVAATPNYEIPLNFALPAGYTIYLTYGGTTVTNGWYATVIGGRY
jgi:hypothetical protein